MSEVARWAYTAKATVWRCVGEDGYGKKQFGEPVIIDCDYGMDKSNKLDGVGLGFTVKNTFWTETEATAEDYILLGENSNSDPIKAGADRIRHVIRYADTFDRLADDFALITAV